MSNPEQESATGGAAGIAALQGIAIEPQANRPGSEEGLKCPQADADIFNALFSKWGRDEEASMVGSFDDLLWDEGAAAVAAAAASMGWQRTATPSVPSLSKPLCSEAQRPQLQHRAWEQASAQQLHQDQQSKPGPMIGQQLLCGSTIINPVPKVHLAAQENSCGDKVQCAVPSQTTGTGTGTGTEAAKDDMQQVHPGCMLPTPLPATAPTAAAAAAAQSVAEQLAASVPMAAPDAGSLQQLSAAFAAGQMSAGGSRILPQLSLQSMLHLQQQLMTEVVVGSSAHQPQQQVVPSISSLYSYQLSAQQVVQPVVAAAAGASSWFPGNVASAGGLDTTAAAAAAAGGWGSILGLAGLQQGGLGGGLDAAASFLAMQTAVQQQQQLLRPPGPPLGLPLPGAAPCLGPGLGWLGSDLTTSAPFGLLPAGGMFNPAAAFAGGLGAPQQVAAGQQLLLQQAVQQLQQQQQQLQEAQAPQQQVAAGLLDGQVAATGTEAGANSTRQSFTAMLGEAAYLPTAAAAATVMNSASATGGGLGLMGPPPPHAPPGAAAAATGVAAANSNSVLAQMPAQLPQLPELLGVLGLGAGQLGGAVGAAGLQLPALPNLPPLFPGSWPLHLAGLLRPPAVQTTNILQLAMMMQSAMQASPVPGAGDTQQAAMVVAALQGLAANMRMLMPWTNSPAPWQPRAVVPQQHELPNGSCLASGGVLPRQLSSSYGAGGQKAVLQFGSQPQTSTTDISGQAGLPGCHSHPTAVAAVGVPMPGLTSAAIGVMGLAGVQRLDSLERHEAAPKPKQKRKQRHPENRARYEGRKIRANNRVRVKGRFVKMGPNGPILPASEANEQHHSEHEASDAELTDPDNHDHHHSSSEKPHPTTTGAAVAAMAGAASSLAGVGGISKVRRTSKAGTEEAGLPPAGDAAAPGSPSNGPRTGGGDGVQALCSAAAKPSWTEDVGTAGPWHSQEVRTKCCCTGAGDGCPVCRDSSAAASVRSCVGRAGQSREGQQLCRHSKWCSGAQCKGAAAGWPGVDRALWHAGDGPCCCDDPMCSSGGPSWAAGIASDGCGATSADGLGAPADDSCGGHANRLVRQHSHKAAKATHSTCSEQQPAADHALAAVDGAGMPAGAGQGLTRELELPTMYSSLGINAAAGTAAAGLACAGAGAKRHKSHHSCEPQWQCVLTSPDAAEAAAMPVPESEMPHPVSLLEHLQQQPAALDPCDAAAAPAPEKPVAAPPPAVRGNAGAAGFAGAAAEDEGTAADVDMADAAVVPEVEKVDVLEQQEQDQQEQGQIDVVCCGKHTQQLAAPQGPPGTAQPSAAAVMQLTAVAGQATTAHLVQAAVTDPADGVAAAALQHWTSTQQQEGSPEPAQPLPASLWGSSLGFRAWGTGRPAGVLAPPSLPLGMPLPVNLLAAAPFAGVGGAVSSAGQVLPDVPALPAVTAGSMPPPASFNLTATLAALQQQGTSPGPLSPAVSAAAGAGGFSPWALPGALLGPPVAGLPVVGGQPASCSPAPGVQLLGGQFVHGHVRQLMPLHGSCWPLAAAAVGRFAAAPQRQPRQRRRGQAAAESEQTDSCPK